jgi:hypothetical protein
LATSEFKTCEVAKDYTSGAAAVNRRRAVCGKTKRERKKKKRPAAGEELKDAAAGTSEATFTP